MLNELHQEVDAVFGRLTEIRHELHAHPELSYQEHETARRVAGWLGELPALDVRTGLGGGTGVFARLDTGRPGPYVVLRGDMDALPIRELSDLPYKSTNDGVMHACGHDGHTTCLLGAAIVLSKLRDRLSGKVGFLFQPAEESGAGALAMIRDGVLEAPTPDAIFGLHGSPLAPVGSISTRPGPINASADAFAITITGKGCHGAAPHQGRDPIPVLGHLLVALQSIVARNVDPVDSAVVTIGQVTAGSAPNIIPDEVRLRGTVRALNQRTRELLHRRVDEVVARTAAAQGCKGHVDWGDTGYPVNSNNAKLVEWTGRVAGELLGSENVQTDRKVGMGGEDFAFYAQRVPSTFFYVGVRPRDCDSYPALHTPYYDFHDDALRSGVLVHCGVVLQASAAGLPDLDG